MTKQPSYRFGGYTEVWEEKKLGDVAEIVGGGTPSTSVPDYWDGDIDWYSPVEIGTKIFVNSSQRKITQQGLVKSSAKMLPIGTILFTSRAGIGSTAILAKEGCTNQGFQSIVPNQESLDNYFIFSLSHELKRYGEVTGAGSTFVEVSGKQMAKMPISLPSLPEQTAIGSFFQDIDQLISLQQRKLEVLKEQKKTYLKLLFPAKGQTKPALRFAGFEDDWKEVKLGEVAELKRGLTYKPTSVVENGIRVLRSSNIDGDVFKKQEDDVFVEDSSVTIPYVQFGDILITAANGSSKLVGKHAIIEDSEKMVHGGFMLLARSKQYKFLNALLSSEWYSRFINVSVAGGNGAIGNLSKSNLEKEIVLCPTIPEQEAIGSFFQDLDKAIAKLEEKVNQLKESKQTLLRKMFI